MLMRKINVRIQHGFSMIEILVTLLIIAMAMLGTAGMQAYALKVGQGGQFRNQAVFLAADMAERIEANKAYAASGVGYVGTLNSSVDCVTNGCSATELAAYDVTSWNAAIAQLLPGGLGTITPSTNGNLHSYIVKVSWLDRRVDVNYATTAAISTNTSVSGGEDVTATGGTRLSVTTTKTIKD